VQTAPGEGSTFIVDLARTDPPAEADGVPAAVRAVAAEVALPPASVLYIEDNAANLRLVRDVLGGRPQVQLATATEGLTGLDVARRSAPDLILLDVHLPDIGGDEVLARLKADPATAAIPVIVISADAGAGHERRFVGAGADAYLTKPLDVDRFLATVRDALAVVRPAHAVPPTPGADG
jgi:CheY-like chemotaxis protein